MPGFISSEGWSVMKPRLSQRWLPRRSADQFHQHQQHAQKAIERQGCPPDHPGMRAITMAMTRNTKKRDMHQRPGLEMPPAAE
jgi:hypothetical protein